MTSYTNTYDPTNPTQAAFLAALQSGENASGNPSLGYGGVNLANAPTNQYGFPLWGGAATSAGTTHAAGLYQFQPGTWNGIASQLGLNFSNPADQNAAAWDLASANYAAANNGASLQSALASGDYSGVANSLNSTWTSLTPSRLASAFGSSASPTSTGTGGTTPASATGASGGIAGAIADYLGLTKFQNDIVNMFIRGGVFILAIVIIGFGLYFLADNASGGKVSEGVKSAAIAA